MRNLNLEPATDSLAEQLKPVAEWACSFEYGEIHDQIWNALVQFDTFNAVFDAIAWEVED